MIATTRATPIKHELDYQPHEIPNPATIKLCRIAKMVHSIHPPHYRNSKCNAAFSCKMRSSFSGMGCPEKLHLALGEVLNDQADLDGGISGLRPSFGNPIFPQLAVERRLANAKQSGSRLLITLELLQRADDRLLLHFRQWNNALCTALLFRDQSLAVCTRGGRSATRGANHLRLLPPAPGNFPIRVRSGATHRRESFHELRAGGVSNPSGSEIRLSTTWVIRGYPACAHVREAGEG